MNVKKCIPIIRALLPSLFFCFRNLPFCQAVKLPILLYKPHLRGSCGGVKIDSERVTFGMVRLGFLTSVVYSNNGITIKNEGTIIFKGRCCIGNDSYIVTGKKGIIIFGQDFKATAGLKLVSECGITFGKNVLIGWGNIIIDTNFHPLFDRNLQNFKKSYGSIEIGDNNWLSSQCMVMHSVRTSKDCVFGTRCLLTKNCNYESHNVYGGAPARVICRNVERIVGQDSINDYSF